MGKISKILEILKEKSFSIPPDLGHITKYVPYVISFITQTFTFCFTGSLLISWVRKNKNF